MQQDEWVIWGQCGEWGLISVQSGEVQMHQLCWKMAPIVAEWSSFLRDTSSLLFHVLKGLFRFDHLDGNQYNRGWGQILEITPCTSLRPGLCAHNFSHNPGDKPLLVWQCQELDGSLHCYRPHLITDKMI